MDPSQYSPSNTPASDEERNLAMQSLGIITNEPTPPTPPTPPAKKKPKMAFAIAALAFSIIVAVALTVMSSRDTPVNTDETGVQFTATALADYSRVCNGAIATNAAQPTGEAPYRSLLFEKSTEGSFIQSSMTTTDTTWLADDNAVSKVEYVGCVERKQQTSSNMSCKMIDDKEALRDVPQHNATYQVSFVAPATGAKLGSIELTSQAQPCPILPIVDSSSTAIYTKPTSDSLSKALEGLIQN